MISVLRSAQRSDRCTANAGRDCRSCVEAASAQSRPHAGPAEHHLSTSGVSARLAHMHDDCGRGSNESSDRRIPSIQCGCQTDPLCRHDPSQPAAQPRRLLCGASKLAHEVYQVSNEQPRCALRAGRKSGSTPRWTFTRPLSNHTPPRFARSAGFGPPGSQANPSKSRERCLLPGRHGDLNVFDPFDFHVSAQE